MSLMNKDEALRCLSIAQRKLEERNPEGALKFCRKSLALCPTPEAEALLAAIEGGASASTSAREAPEPGEGVRQRHGPGAGAGSSQGNGREQGGNSAGEKTKNHTPEQEKLVQRVIKCKHTEYYEILGLSRDCSDVDIKKAYRKLALGLHPDKCNAPGAEDAFKRVGKAFNVLSDPQKRSIYNQTGSDPDSRGVPSSSGAASGFARSPFAAQNGGFSEDFAPDDFLRFFFTQAGGGGMFSGGNGFAGGNGFSAGPGFTYQFYGPGGRAQPGRAQPGRAAPRRDDPPARPASFWLQLAPIILLVFISLLGNLSSLFSTSPPEYSFAGNSRFDVARKTQNLGVDYFVNGKQFAQHPFYTDLLRENPDLGFASTYDEGTQGYKSDLVQHLKSHTGVKPTKIPPALFKFEKKVENDYVNHINSLCQREIRNRAERIDRVSGIFGIGANVDEIRRLQNMRLQNCEKLANWGYQVHY